uniref:SET domain-containing protein n=1 Tax=Pundamilia nyererei TaxID=303518 RepID=A0A3B4H713_9CICH
MPSCRPGLLRNRVYKTTSPSRPRLQSRSGRAWLCKTLGNGRAKVKCTHHLDYTVFKLQVNVSKSPVMTDGLFQLTGVIALMPFCKGDVVCNYHGTYISEAEEKRRPQLGYLFFFRGKCDRGMCINATAFPCETILFIALKDIAVGEELLWDNGVTHKSYGGIEGDTWLRHAYSST